MIYSAHDTQIANLLTHFVPNFNYTEVKYAAHFKFELRIDNTCLKGQTGSPDISNCFNVRVIYNGQYIDILNGKLYPDGYKNEIPKKSVPQKDYQWEKQAI